MAGRPKNSGIDFADIRRNLRKGSGKPKFLYKQLAELIHQEVSTGIFNPGDMLPSMDDLASQYNINKATVRQAITELAERGILYSVPAKGTFVSDPDTIERPSKKNDILTIGWISSINDKGKIGGYHMEMMHAARRAVQKKGGNFLLFSSDDIENTSFWDMVMKAELDGGLFVGPPQEEPLRSLLSRSMPAVVLNDKFRSHKVSSIIIDNEDGGYQAVDHLIKLGHRRMAFVTGHAQLRIVKERLLGAHAACEAHGIDPEMQPVIEGDFSPEGGVEAMKKILLLEDRPTGIFFFNDEMACSAQSFLFRETDLRVPDDFSFVGFDDISWASMCYPQLTTISVETELMGRKAVDALVSLISGDDVDSSTSLVIPVRLVPRDSTRAKPEA